MAALAGNRYTLARVQQPDREFTRHFTKKNATFSFLYFFDIY